MGHIYVCDKCGKRGEALGLELFTIGDRYSERLEFGTCNDCADDFRELAEEWLHGTGRGSKTV